MTENGTPHTAYLPHGTDRVEASPDGSVWLICRQPKGWTARHGSGSRGEHAGTAVRWESDLFEVVEALAAADGTVRYKLVAWEPRHVVRAIRQYDAASESERVRAPSLQRRSIAKRRLAIVFSPILGHLPGWVQERMESEFGAPALAMTIVSALPLLVLGFVSFLFTLTAAFGAGYAAASGVYEGAPRAIPHLLAPPLALYLLFESGIRLAAAFLQNRPIGSLAGTLLFETWNTALGRPHRPPLLVRGTAATPEQALKDRFRMLEPLVALLSPAEQDLLDQRFEFDPVRWGKRTVLLLGTVAGLNVFASLGMLLAGKAGSADVVWLLIGAILGLEQLFRWRSLSRGRPAGSLLGGLVRPLARKLLEADSRAP